MKKRTVMVAEAAVAAAHRRGKSMSLAEVMENMAWTEYYHSARADEAAVLRDAEAKRKRQAEAIAKAEAEAEAVGEAIEAYLTAKAEAEAEAAAKAEAAKKALEAFKAAYALAAVNAAMAKTIACKFTFELKVFVETGKTIGFVTILDEVRAKAAYWTTVRRNTAILEATIDAAEAASAAIASTVGADGFDFLSDMKVSNGHVEFEWDMQRFAEKSSSEPCIDNTTDEETENHQFFVGRAKLDDKHEHNHVLVDLLKNHEGNMTVYMITPDYDAYANTMSCDIATVSVPVSVVTKPYMQENCALAGSAIGHLRIVARGSEAVVVVNLAKLASDPRKILCLQYFTDHEFFMIVDKKQAEGKGSVQLAVRALKEADKVVFISGGGCQKRDLSVLRDKRGYKHGVTRFAPDASINSTSQGRKDQMLAFKANSKTDVKRFRDIVDRSMVGELSLMEGRVMKTSQVVDTNARISGRLAPAGATNVFMPNELIWFNGGKYAENTDGHLLIKASAIAEGMAAAKLIPNKKRAIMAAAAALVGELDQMRHGGKKAAGAVVDDDAVELVVSRLKIKTIYADSITENEIKAMNIMLNKYDRKAAKVVLGKPETYPELLNGYDAVRIVRNRNAVLDGIVANTNAIKNCIDLKVIDGLNLLAVAHFDDPAGNYRLAMTGNQIWKVVMKAMDNTSSKALKRKGINLIKRIIRRQIDDDLASRSSGIKGLGRETVDCSYVSGIIAAVNPTLSAKYFFAGVMAGIIRDMSNRVNGEINRDRYGVAGHSAMLTCDMCYVLTGRRVLEMTDDVIEVYDPVWEKYAAEKGLEKVEGGDKGLGFKFPDMGTMEFLKIRFVSLEEIKARIASMAAEVGWDKHTVSVIQKVFSTFKYGGAMIPAYLKRVAEIAAGLDLDGDKLCIMFNDVNQKGVHYDLVSLVWESGLRSRAVDIGAPHDQDDTIQQYSLRMYPYMMKRTAEFGNHPVGIVTVAMHTFTDVYAHISNVSDEGKKFYLDLFKDVFVDSLKFLASKDKDVKARIDGLCEASKDYEPQVGRKVKDGAVTYVTTDDVVDRVCNAIFEMRMTWDNILKALDDLDVLGRHLQELTIDAQKKFYVVEAQFIDRMHGYALLDRCQWPSIVPDFVEGTVDFDIISKANYDFLDNEGYMVDGDGVLHVTPVSYPVRGQKQIPIAVLADGFSGLRVYAFNYAMKKFMVLMDKYNKAKARAEENSPFMKEILDMALTTDPRIGKLVSFYANYGRTARAGYRNMEKEIKAEIGYDASIDDDDQIDLDIRRFQREQFATVCESISNELRKLGREAGLSPTDLYGLVVALMSKTDFTRIQSGPIELLKEESVLWALQYSEIQTYSKTIENIPKFIMDDIRDTLAVIGTQVTLVHSKFTTVGGKDIRVNLMDGTWDVELGEDTMTMSRPISDFVAVPEPDYGRQLVQLDLGTTITAAATDAVYRQYNAVLDNVSKEIALKRGKYGRGYDAVVAVDANGSQIADKVWAGSFRAQDKIGGSYQFNVVSDRIIGKGRVENVLYVETDMAGGAHHCYALMTLSGFEPERKAAKVETAAAVKFDANALMDVNSAIFTD